MQTSLSSDGRPLRLQAHHPATPGPHPAILLLHGAGGNVGYWLDRIAPAITAQGIAAFAVHYFDRTGTTRATPAQLADGIHVPQWLQAVEDTVSHIAHQTSIDPRRIALVGISLGAFLALALGTKSPQSVRALVDISGGLAPPYEANATAIFPPTLILHGDQDTVVPVSFAHSLARTLIHLGVSHQVEILPGEGHWFSAAAQLRLLTATAAFLQIHLLAPQQNRST